MVGRHLGCLVYEKNIYLAGGYNQDKENILNDQIRVNDLTQYVFIRDENGYLALGSIVVTDDTSKRIMGHWNWDETIIHDIFHLPISLNIKILTTSAKWKLESNKAVAIENTYVDKKKDYNIDNDEYYTPRSIYSVPIYSKNSINNNFYQKIIPIVTTNQTYTYSAFKLMDSDIIKYNLVYNPWRLKNPNLKNSVFLKRLIFSPGALVDEIKIYYRKNEKDPYYYEINTNNVIMHKLTSISSSSSSSNLDYFNYDNGAFKSVIIDTKNDIKFNNKIKSSGFQNTDIYVLTIKNTHVYDLKIVPYMNGNIVGEITKEIEVSYQGVNNFGYLWLNMRITWNELNDNDIRFTKDELVNIEFEDVNYGSDTYNIEYKNKNRKGTDFIGVSHFPKTSLRQENSNDLYELVTEDSVTEDSVTEDSITADSITEDSDRYQGQVYGHPGSAVVAKNRSYYSDGYGYGRDFDYEFSQENKIEVLEEIDQARVIFEEIKAGFQYGESKKVEPFDLKRSTVGSSSSSNITFYYANRGKAYSWIKYKRLEC